MLAIQVNIIILKKSYDEVFNNFISQDSSPKLKYAIRWCRL